jgi:hypothetical protein
MSAMSATKTKTKTVKSKKGKLSFQGIEISYRMYVWIEKAKALNKTSKEIARGIYEQGKKDRMSNDNMLAIIRGVFPYTPRHLRRLIPLELKNINMVREQQPTTQAQKPQQFTKESPEIADIGKRDMSAYTVVKIARGTESWRQTISKINWDSIYDWDKSRVEITRVDSVSFTEEEYKIVLSDALERLAIRSLDVKKEKESKYKVFGELKALKKKYKICELCNVKMAGKWSGNLYCKKHLDDAIQFNENMSPNLTRGMVKTAEFLAAEEQKRKQK